MSSRNQNELLTTPHWPDLERTTSCAYLVPTARVVQASLRARGATGMLFANGTADCFRGIDGFRARSTKGIHVSSSRRAKPAAGRGGGQE
jgi:hypothetical protein